MEESNAARLGQSRSDTALGKHYHPCTDSEKNSVQSKFARSRSASTSQSDPMLLGSICPVKLFFRSLTFKMQ